MCVKGSCHFEKEPYQSGLCDKLQAVYETLVLIELLGIKIVKYFRVLCFLTSKCLVE